MSNIGNHSQISGPFIYHQLLDCSFGPPLETHRLRSTEPQSNRVRLKWHCLQFLICIPSSVHRKMKMMPMVAKQLQQLTVQSHPGIASIPRKASQVVIHDPLIRWIPYTTGCNMPWLWTTCYSRMHIHHPIFTPFKTASSPNNAKKKSCEKNNHRLYSTNEPCVGYSTNEAFVDLQ